MAAVVVVGEGGRETRMEGEEEKVEGGRSGGK